MNERVRGGVVTRHRSGLDQSADVLFNGVAVGRVTGIRIWEKDPGNKSYRLNSFGTNNSVLEVTPKK